MGGALIDAPNTVGSIVALSQLGALTSHKVCEICAPRANVCGVCVERDGVVALVALTQRPVRSLSIALVAGRTAALRRVVPAPVCHCGTCSITRRREHL